MENYMELYEQKFNEVFRYSQQEINEYAKRNDFPLEYVRCPKDVIMQRITEHYEEALAVDKKVAEMLRGSSIYKQENMDENNLYSQPLLPLVPQNACEDENAVFGAMLDYMKNKPLVARSEISKMTQELLENIEEIKAEYFTLKKGEDGEEYVSRNLSLLKDKYIIRENVLIPAHDAGGETSETDIYIITSKGLLVCEVKNWGNENTIFQIASDGQWSQVFDDGVMKKAIKENPVMQNTRHCLATERFLKNNGISDFKIIPVVIFGNETAQIRNQSNNTIIRISELYSFIEGLNLPEKYSQEEQAKIAELFDNCKVEVREFEIPKLAREPQEYYDLLKELLVMYDMEFKALGNVSDFARAELSRLDKKNTKQGLLIMVVGIVVIGLLIKLLLF